MKPYEKNINDVISAMVDSVDSAKNYLEALDERPSKKATANSIAIKAAGHIAQAAMKATKANQSAWSAIVKLSEVEHPGAYEICQKLWLQLCVDMTALIGVGVLDSELAKNLSIGRAYKSKKTYEDFARIQAERITTFYPPCASILKIMLAPEDVLEKTGSFSEAVDSLRKLHASCELLGEGSAAEVATSMRKIESGLLGVIATMYEEKRKYREKRRKSPCTSENWYGAIEAIIGRFLNYLDCEYEEMTNNTGKIPSYERLRSSERPDYWLSEDHMMRVRRIKKAAHVLAEILAVAEETSEELEQASAEKTQGA